ncbi:MAG TPA: hypothetical protein PL009_06345 [Flavipsychrobacter sp.]|nr:hypothetical protein [Flavipsychrobacter sp.]
MLLIFCLLNCTSCINTNKKTSWRVTLDKKDKKPYGGFLAYQSLQYFFPKADILALSRGFRYGSIDSKMMSHKNGKTLLVAVGLDFYLSEIELKKLIAFVKEGNEVIIFARQFDDKLQQLLHCKTIDHGYEETPLNTHNDGSLNLKSLTVANSTKTFGYHGRSILASFIQLNDTTDLEKKNEVDSSTFKHTIPDILGSAKNNPNFIRYKLGDGHISLHAAPLVMSNYFLLQNDNKDYLQRIWNTFPNNISRIYWNDYFKRNSKASDLSVLLNYPATRWAFFIAIFGLLVYVLFESKRRQRIIPVLTSPENNSVSFVETVGRLYYNHGNHTNLGEKIIQHFFEWVRTHYFLSTTRLDEQFERQLIQKSALPETTIKTLLERIKAVHIERKEIDETELYQLYNIIQQFYKNDKQ